MTSKTVTSLAFAAGCVLALGAMPSAHAQNYPQRPVNMGTTLETNGPQASRGDFGDWSARRNNIESAHYDRLLQTNLAFRRAREHKECGPISDAQLRDQCLASFQQYEPVMVGSSMPPRWSRYHARMRTRTNYSNAGYTGTEPAYSGSSTGVYNERGRNIAGQQQGYPQPFANPTYPGPRPASTGNGSRE